MNLIFVRHGQSVWNLENKFTGWVDVGLSENGVKEASNAGDLLINEKFIPDICFTSFLKRSIDTADILLNKYENKLNKLTGIFSSNGPIAVTTIERTKEKGKLSKELKAKHKLIKSIDGNKTIYCSPGHLIGFTNKDENENLKKFLFKNKIESNIHYPIPIHKQKIFNYKSPKLIKTEKQSHEILSLPINQYLNEKDIKKSLECIDGVDFLISTSEDKSVEIKFDEFGILP